MWIEKLLKKLMLIIGILGVVVIYGGFFYLQFGFESVEHEHANHLPWYILLSPWLCIYFGLSEQQQSDVVQWFKKQLGLK